MFFVFVTFQTVSVTCGFSPTAVQKGRELQYTSRFALNQEAEAYQQVGLRVSFILHSCKP